MNVAVIMTVFDTPGDWLTEAVHSALCQMRWGDEMIIWDDGSTREDTLAALINLPHGVFRHHCTSNQGIATASNSAISLTEHPLICRLDADDRLLPGVLDALRTELDKSGDVVSGSMIYIRPDGTRFKNVDVPVMTCSAKHQNRIVHSGCMFRRSLWETVGGYPPMRFADWHLWEAAERAGAKFTVINQPVIERRIHPDSFSFTRSVHLQREWKRAQR